MNQEKVLIAMSGGVDSSAAALLLQKQGYACDGAMLRLYAGEQESGCCSESDAADARSVAYRLGMKFYVFNETERFARDVMDHFVAEYCAGHTPNPCIDCNRCLKFERAARPGARVLGYDYIVDRATTPASSATGRAAAGGSCSGRSTEQQGPELRALSSSRSTSSRTLLSTGGRVAHKRSHPRQRPRGAGLLQRRQGRQSGHLLRPGRRLRCRYLRATMGHVELTPRATLSTARRPRARAAQGPPLTTPTGQRKGLGVSAAEARSTLCASNAADNTVLLERTTPISSTDDAHRAGRQLDCRRDAAAPPSAATAQDALPARREQPPARPLSLPDGRLRVTFDEPQRAVTAGSGRRPLRRRGGAGGRDDRINFVKKELCSFLMRGFRSEPRVLPAAGGQNTLSPRKVFLRRTRRRKKRI